MGSSSRERRGVNQVAFLVVFLVGVLFSAVHALLTTTFATPGSQGVRGSNPLSSTERQTSSHRHGGRRPDVRIMPVMRAMYCAEIRKGPERFSGPFLERAV